VVNTEAVQKKLAFNLKYCLLRLG